MDKEQGVPKTDEERKAMHKKLHGDEKLPLRGTGLKQEIFFTSGMGQNIWVMEEGKTYVKNPAEAPKGVALKRGPKGGYYYDEPSGGQKQEPTQGPKPEMMEDKIKKQFEAGKTVWVKTPEGAGQVTDISRLDSHGIIEVRGYGENKAYAFRAGDIDLIDDNEKTLPDDGKELFEDKIARLLRTDGHVELVTPDGDMFIPDSIDKDGVVIGKIYPTGEEDKYRSVDLEFYDKEPTKQAPSPTQGQGSNKMLDISTEVEQDALSMHKNGDSDQGILDVLTKQHELSDNDAWEVLQNVKSGDIKQQGQGGGEEPKLNDDLVNSINRAAKVGMSNRNQLFTYVKSDLSRKGVSLSDEEINKAIDKME